MILTGSEMREVKKLTGCGFYTIDFGAEFADRINNLTDSSSIEEANLEDEVSWFRHRYLFEGICEGLVSDDEELDKLYYIICKVKHIRPHDLSKGRWSQFTLNY